mgnify:CR=1 FL=1
MWARHARGYGLFAANPLGQAVFSEGKEKLDFLLKRGQNQLFRYRVLIADREVTPAELKAKYAQVGEALDENPRAHLGVQLDLLQGKLGGNPLTVDGGLGISLQTFIPA